MKKKTEKARKEAREDKKLDAAEDAEIAAEKSGMVEPNRNQNHQQQMKMVKKKVNKKRNIEEAVETPSRPKLGERFRESEVKTQKIEMEWPCIEEISAEEILRPFSGTLHTCMTTGKQYITFEGKRRYHVASVVARGHGFIVRFTPETLKQRSIHQGVCSLQDHDGRTLTLPNQKYHPAPG